MLQLSVAKKHVVRVLLEKGEVIRAGGYLSKIVEKNLVLEASTVELQSMISLSLPKQYFVPPLNKKL